MPINGSASVLTESLRPSSATIQPVLVVPRFAPMMTPIALLKLSRPAETKPMVARVVALELCTKAVSPAPEATADQRLPVKRAKKPLSASPATALRPSVMRIIPSRNNPIPPKTVAEVPSMWG